MCGVPVRVDVQPGSFAEGLINRIGAPAFAPRGRPRGWFSIAERIAFGVQDMAGTS
jgi:hypothetical protein